MFGISRKVWMKFILPAVIVGSPMLAWINHSMLAALLPLIAIIAEVILGVLPWFIREIRSGWGELQLKNSRR